MTSAMVAKGGLIDWPDSEKWSINWCHIRKSPMHKIYGLRILVQSGVSWVETL